MLIFLGRGNLLLEGKWSDLHFMIFESNFASQKMLAASKNTHDSYFIHK